MGQSVVSKPLRVLIIEDSEDDAELLLRELRSGGFEPDYKRVDTPDGMTAALNSAPWSIVLADYSMPHFSGLSALKLLRNRGLDMPFILVSGTVGEDIAVETLHSGAQDYITKGKLARLVPAFERELRAAEARRKRRRSEEGMKRSEALLAEAQQVAHIGNWNWDISENVVTWSDELYRIFGLKPQERAMSFERFIELVHPDDRENVQRVIEAARRDCKLFEFEHRAVCPDGTVRTHHARGFIAAGKDGKAVRMFGMSQDITERRRMEEWMAGRQRVVEMIAADAALPEILEVLARAVEARSDGLLCSVLLLDEDGQHLRHGAAPSLPEAYNKLVDGLLIGPGAGSCGAAAYRREPVIVTDIASDPLWAGYRAVAAEYGFRACWSVPILCSQGAVLGTFAIYAAVPRGPSEQEQQLIDVAMHMASIAIERRRSLEALQNSESRLRLVIEQLPAVLWTTDTALRFTSARGAGLKMQHVRINADASQSLYDFFETRDESFPPIAAHRRALSGQGTSFETVWKARTFSNRVEPLYDAAGSIVGVIGLAQDMTDRYRAAEQLQTSLSLLTATLESTADGILVVDNNRRVVAYNQKFLQMWKIPQSLAESGDDEKLVEFVSNQLTSPEDFYRRVEDIYAHSLEISDLLVFKDGRVFERYSQPQRVAGGTVGRVFSFRDITARTLAESKMKSSGEQLRALAARIQAVREEERTHIAREIHDELGQALLCLKLDLSWVEKRLSEARFVGQQPALNRLTLMMRLLDTTIQSVRSIATELRPGVLDDLGLAAAIEWQAKEFQQRSGIECYVSLPVEDLPLDPIRATALFRILQESLTNVARYSGATQVQITLEAREGELNMEVYDNGQGIAEERVTDSKSIGLLGMRERAAIMGGRLSIRGVQGKGTTVTARVPLGKGAAHDAHSHRG